ncbi:MAG: hypothetical protein V8R28_11345 [Bacteroides cellulosilyticus]|jgi:O-antigen/teichoic acid export membrane protein
MIINLKRDLVYTFAAQGMAILLNLMLNLLVPKVLGIEAFSYWQLFLFYSVYIGFFQFGLNDGIYLKYGGKDYNDINHKLIGGQFGILIVSQIVLFVLLFVLISIYVYDKTRSLILYLTLLNMFETCLIGFITYMFQATCRIASFAKIIMLEKFSLFILLVFLLILKVNDFYFYIYIFLISKTISLCYSLWIASKVIKWVYLLWHRDVLIEAKNNYISGSKLMLAVVSSLLLIGISRYVVDYKWGIVAFGKFSLALSLMNFILLFISQAGMVLFPFLRNLTKQEARDFYLLSDRLLNVLLYFALCLYYPLSLFIFVWLPQYKESLFYFSFLLPICVFDGKVQMLFMPYLKTFRKESLLLGINLASLLLNVSICLYAIHIEQLFLVLLALLLSVILKAFLLGMAITRILNIAFLRIFLLDIIAMLIFLYSYVLSDKYWTNFLYPFCFLIFFIMHFRKLRMDYYMIKKIV